MDFQTLTFNGLCHFIMWNYNWWIHDKLDGLVMNLVWGEDAKTQWKVDRDGITNSSKPTKVTPLIDEFEITFQIWFISIDFAFVCWQERWSLAQCRITSLPIQFTITQGLTMRFHLLKMNVFALKCEVLKSPRSETKLAKQSSQIPSHDSWENDELLMGIVGLNHGKIKVYLSRLDETEHYLLFGF